MVQEGKSMAQMSQSHHRCSVSGIFMIVKPRNMDSHLQITRSQVGGLLLLEMRLTNFPFGQPFRGLDRKAQEERSPIYSLPLCSRLFRSFTSFINPTALREGIFFTEQDLEPAKC